AVVECEDVAIQLFPRVTRILARVRRYRRAAREPCETEDNGGPETALSQAAWHGPQRQVCPHATSYRRPRRRGYKGTAPSDFPVRPRSASCGSGRLHRDSFPTHAAT